jgi:hypothetical protein
MKKITFIIGLVFLCSWVNYPATSVRKAEWLIGTWENKTSRGSIFETWTKVSEEELAGKSYILKEKDTIVFESIRLVQLQNGLFYIPTVKNQNDGLPVRFSLKTISDTGLVFENLQHDFPQVISYTRINADSLVAEISGIKNGMERKEVFAMKKLR